jgi:hypothetical protein
MSPEPPSNIPLPNKPVQLVRAAVSGVTDRIAELKTYVIAQPLDEHIKNFVLKELDGLTSNAAELHLHDVEMPGGGFNLHLTIKPKHLGGSSTAVFVRRPS